MITYKTDTNLMHVVPKGKKIEKHTKREEYCWIYKKEIRLGNIPKGKKIGEHTKSKEYLRGYKKD